MRRHDSVSGIYPAWSPAGPGNKIFFQIWNLYALRAYLPYDCYVLVFTRP